MSTVQQIMVLILTLAVATEQLSLLMNFAAGLTHGYLFHYCEMFPS